MAETIIRPPLIAFGTLSNGRSAQLLARSPGAAVVGEETGAIESMFETVRSLIGPQTESAFAFLPLGGNDARRWGLCRFDPMGMGAIGWCGVIWVLLLDRTTLDSIDWAVHGLMATAFPTPRLPEPDEPLDTPTVRVDTTAMLPAAACRGFDLVAEPSNTAPKVLLVMPPGAGQPLLSTDAAIHVLWGRKRPQWRRLSFTSWSGLGIDFDLVAVEADSTGAVPGDLPFASKLAERLALPVAAGMTTARLPLLDEIARAADGITFDPRPADSEGDYAAAGAKLATSLLVRHEDAGALFAALADELRTPALVSHPRMAAPAFATALQYCLDEDDQRAVIKTFFAAVDMIEGLWQTPGFAARCAAIIIGASALPELSATALRRLQPALLSPADAPLVTTPEAAGQLVASRNLKWSQWWPLLDKALTRRPATGLAAAAAAALAGTPEGDAAMARLSAGPDRFWPKALVEVRQPALQRQRAIAGAIAVWMAGADNRLAGGGMAWLRHAYFAAAHEAQQQSGAQL